MPRILDMKVEGQDLWVRIERILGEESPIHLWTDKEAKLYRCRIRQELMDEINYKFDVNG